MIELFSEENLRPTPQQVAEKIVSEHTLFGHQRYIAQMSVGAVSHRDVLHSMELFGTEVAPLVRSELAATTAGASGHHREPA